MFWLYVGIVLAVLLSALWFWERGRNHRVGRLDSKVLGQADRSAEQAHRHQTRNTFGGNGSF